VSVIFLQFLTISDLIFLATNVTKKLDHYTFPYYNSNSFFPQDSYMKRHKSINLGTLLIIFMQKKQFNVVSCITTLTNDTGYLSLMIHGTYK